MTGKEAGISGLVFLALGLAFFYDMIGADPIFGGGDVITFFIPFRQLWLKEAADFTFPLWNPYILSGNPLFATLQPAILYPLSLLFILLPFFLALNLTYILHYGLAGWFMYLFMRAQACGRRASVVSALVYMFCGYMVTIRGYLSVFIPVVWAPLLLLCFFAGLRKQDLRWAWASAAVGACMFLSGGIETCYQVFALLGVFALFPGWLLQEDELPGWKWRAGYLMLFAAAFFGLTAVQFLPTFEFSRLSDRAAGLPLSEATRWSMAPRDLLQLFLLDPFGYLTDSQRYSTNQVWLRSIYMGAIPFILAALYLRRGGRRAGVVLIAIIMVSVLTAMGPNGGLHAIFYQVLPFFDSFRYPVKFIFSAVLAVAILAGWGWDRFERTSREQSPEQAQASARWWILFATAGMIAFGALNVFEQPLIDWITDQGWVPPDFNKPRINLFNLKRLTVFASLFAFFLFMHLRARKFRTIFLTTALIVFALDIGFSGFGFYYKIPIKEFQRQDPLTAFLRQDPSTYRVYLAANVERGKPGDMARTKVRGQLLQSSMAPLQIRTELGIYQADGWAVMRQMRYWTFRKILRVPKLEDRLNLISLANVKYVVSRDPLNSDQLRPVEFHDPSYPELKVYENLGRLPRAFLVRACRVITDENEMISTLLNPAFDPSRLLLLEEAPPNLSCDTPLEKAPLSGRVEITRLGYDTVELEAETDRPVPLFLADSWYPGWRATVDGEPVPLYRAQFVFRAIVLPAGTHQVRFEYQPSSFRWGMAISLLTVVLGAGFLLQPKRRYVAATD